MYHYTGVTILYTAVYCKTVSKVILNKLLNKNLHSAFENQYSISQHSVTILKCIAIFLYSYFEHFVRGMTSSRF